jgi:hypothetical protein
LDFISDGSENCERLFQETPQNPALGALEINSILLHPRGDTFYASLFKFRFKLPQCRA